MNIFGKRENEAAALFVLRWTARILSIGVVFLVTLFAFGNDGVTSGPIRDHEYIGLFFFPVGIILGFIIGWTHEMLGGIISTASLACFYLVYELAIMGSVPRGPWFAVFNIPGFLFLSYGLIVIWRHNDHRPHGVKSAAVWASLNRINKEGRG